MTDSEQPVAVSGNVSKITTMADGSVRLQIDLPDTLLQTAARLCPHGQLVGIAPIQQRADVPHGTDDSPHNGRHSDSATMLWLSSFFLTPDVWERIGPDSDFLAWCRGQVCVVTGERGTDDDPVQAAHVRRVSDGAGTGIKPRYSAVPMLASVHRRQHEQGESAVGGREALDKARIETVRLWAWRRLKRVLGYESWRDVPPDELVAWAEKNEVVRHLPRGYADG